VVSAGRKALVSLDIRLINGGFPQILKGLSAAQENHTLIERKIMLLSLVLLLPEMQESYCRVFQWQGSGSFRGPFSPDYEQFDLLDSK
jgi:hypothetical protein